MSIPNDIDEIKNKFLQDPIRLELVSKLLEIIEKGEYQRVQTQVEIYKELTPKYKAKANEIFNQIKTYQVKKYGDYLKYFTPEERGLNLYKEKVIIEKLDTNYT